VYFPSYSLQGTTVVSSREQQFLCVFFLTIPYREQLLFPIGNNTFCVHFSLLFPIGNSCCSLLGITIFMCITFVIPYREYLLFSIRNNTFAYVFICCSLLGIIVVPYREQHPLHVFFLCYSLSRTTVVPSKQQHFFCVFFFVVPYREQHFLCEVFFCCFLKEIALCEYFFEKTLSFLYIIIPRPFLLTLYDPLYGTSI